MDFQSVVVRMLDIFFSNFLIGSGYVVAALIGLRLAEKMNLKHFVK